MQITDYAKRFERVISSVGMHYRGLRLLYWYLLLMRSIQGQTFDLKAFDAFVKQSDLKDLCPYTDFCGHIQNASAQHFRQTSYRSCCHSCSCDPGCGLRGDCCSIELDEYRQEAHNMVCRHLFAEETLAITESVRQMLDNSVHFRMVNKCSGSNMTKHSPSVSCEHGPNGSNRSFNPVFSPFTQNIYVNSYCAFCNNISETTPLRTAITCFEENEPSLFEFMDNVWNGTFSTVFPGCLLHYIPPLETEKTLTCYPKITRQCNTTGLFSVRARFWDWCEMFNATFIHPVLDNSYGYGNVYCFLCNVRIRNHEQVKRMTCKKQAHETGKFLVSNSRLTILLEKTSQNKSSVSQIDRKDNLCPPNMVRIKSFQDTCRSIRCPYGKLMRNNKCDFYSDQWIGGPFGVMLKLIPLKKDEALQGLYLTDMLLTKNQNDKSANWIKRTTLKRWRLLIFYHPTNNQSHFEYIIIKALYPRNSVDPLFLTRSVKKALEDTWEIYYKNLTFGFKLELNKYSIYDRIGKRELAFKGINIKHEFGYFPTWLLCENTYLSINTYPTNLMLLAISDIRIEMLAEGVFVNKLFFCPQIDLLQNEYIYTKCDTIFFKVKNTTLHMFNKIMFPVNDQTNSKAMSVASATLNKMSVRVCIQEFEKNSSPSIVTSHMESTLYKFLSNPRKQISMEIYWNRLVLCLVGMILKWFDLFLVN